MSDPSPMFSVVMPMWNRAALVGASIESVLAQRYPHWELIVVDDGSTDSSLSVARAYTDPRITVLTQSNQGPGAARNLGLSHARGRFVALLDSDDLWFPHTLERAAALLTRGQQVLVLDPVHFESTEQLSDVRDGELQVEEYPQALGLLERLSWISASALVIEREALLGVGGFESRWVYAEDWDLLLRLGLSRADFVIQPKLLAFRRHAGSATSDVPRAEAGLLRLLESERQGRFPGGPGRRDQRMRIISKLVRSNTVSWARARRCDAAWRLYRMTLGWHLRHGRVRYLLALPALCLWNRPRPGPSGGPS